MFYYNIDFWTGTIGEGGNIPTARSNGKELFC